MKFVDRVDNQTDNHHETSIAPSIEEAWVEEAWVEEAWVEETSYPQWDNSQQSAKHLPNDLADMRLQPQRTLNAQKKRYCLETFSDNVMVSASDLQQGDRSYPLKDITTLQIIKLNCRTSVIQKKTTNFISVLLLALGLVIALSPVVFFVRLLGLLGAVLSTSYLARFHWTITHQKTGEYGLLVVLHPNTERVITSHSLKAIQMTYQAVFQRLECADPIAGLLFVDMYTGEVCSDCQHETSDF